MKMKIHWKVQDQLKILVIGISLSIAIPAFSYAAPVITITPQQKEGELIIQLDRNAKVDSFLQSRAASEMGFRKGRLLSRRLNIWLLPYNPATARSRGLASTQEVLGFTRSISNIKKAQANHIVSLRDTVPDDPRFDDQWGLHNTGQSGGTTDADIDAPLAWDTAIGGTSADGDQVVIAVIDAGFDLNHEDLNFWKNTHELPNNGIDDDGNGYIDDFDGWNAYSDNGNIPSSTHGTHVAGIAAAIGNNGTGVSGVNWEASVLPIAGSSGNEATVIAAYSYALEMRARYNETNGNEGAFVVVTNSSFGVDFGSPDDFPIWCEMYNDLGNVGILSVAATANRNIDVDDRGDIPTTCDSPFLISVTNTTDTDTRNAGAAFGLTSIDLGAPGTDILSTIPNNAYGNLTGTSMATPHVVGAIALLFSAAPIEAIQQYKANPAEEALNFRNYLLNGVDQIDALNEITVTGGRLNVANAIDNIPTVPEQQNLAWLVPVISLILN